MYQIGNCACTKNAHILKFCELIIFLPLCCLLVNCMGKPFFLLKQMLLPDIQHVPGTEFLCLNKTVPSSPSQGNSCTVNDWDAFFVPPTVWPPNSPDLNPVDYCVWNVLQERVYYCTKVDNVVDLKQHIVAEWAALDHSIIASAIAQWRLRRHVVFALPVDILTFFEHCLPWHYPLFM